MEDRELRYTAASGCFIDKWLISGLIERPVRMTPAQDIFPGYHPGSGVKDEHGREHQSPAKKEFLKIGDFKRSEYPVDAVTDKLYCSEGSGRVDCSHVFKFPADARLYARAYVICEKACCVKAAMYCAGGMKVWVNGSLCGEYYPYEANIECCEEAILKFNAGKNELLVALNDYGERNIVFRFGLKVIGAELEISLPVSADINKIVSMRKCLDGLYPDRLNYREQQVFLCSEVPFPENFDFSLTAEDLGTVWRTAVKGETKVKLFDREELVSGYYEFTLAVRVEGIELKTQFSIQICPQKAERMSIGLKDLSERKAFCLKYAAESGNTLDNCIASLASGSDEFERFRDEVLKDLDFAVKRGDCADFRVLRFLWLLTKFGERIPDDIRERIEELLLGFRYWFDEPGNDAMWFFSENHSLAFHADEYIAGRLYPDRIFANSGLTGAEHMARAEAKIREWFEKLLNYGYNEWNSATYINVDVLTYITLYCLSEDEEIRILAEKALDLTYRIYAYNSFKGVMGTSNGRAYDKDILGNECMAGNSQIWLAWGIGCINRRVSPAIYLAMSDYEPPKEYRTAACGDFAGRMVQEKYEGTMRVKTYLCKTAQYILGTCVSPRTGGPGSQELLLSLFMNDISTRIWLNLPGEGKVFGIRRPGYFNGNALTPLVTQKENVAAVSYNFPRTFMKRTDVDYVHLMCDEQECDETILTDNSLFIRRGSVFAAFMCSAPLKRTDRACLKGREFVTEGIRSDWLIKVADTEEFGDFKSFVEYHRANRPKTRFGKMIFNDAAMGRMEFPLLTKGYMLRKLDPQKLKSLGVSQNMIRQFVKETVRGRR